MSDVQDGRPSSGEAAERFAAHPASYRALFENDINAVAIFEGDRLIDCNERALDLLGYEREEALGMSAADFSAPVQADGEPSDRKARRILAQVAEGEQLRLEWLCRRRDGTHFHAEAGLSPVHVDGRTYIQVVIADITERKEARRALERSGHRFRALAEQSLVGTYIFRGGTFVYANPRLAEILGYDSADDLVGEIGPLEVTHPDDREKARKAIRNRESGDRSSARYDCRILTPAGDEKTVEVFGTRVDLEGDPAIVGILVDVTEKRTREAELRAAKERAEEASRLKSAFLANMSHEIRTPLASIIGFADVLEKDVSGSGREFVDLIRDSGQRLLETLNSVLDLAQLEGGALELRAESFDAARAVRETVRSLRTEAEKKDLDLGVQIPAEPLEARTDRGVVQRVLTNLLSNALKFTHEGSVTVGLVEEDEFLVLRVVDTGIGIEEDQVESIFQPFQQESEGLTRQYEGSGLGLTISSKLVGLLDGEMDVRSEKEAGTTFTVRIPREFEADGSAGDSLESAHQWGIAQLPDDQKTLVVEDDPNMQTLLGEYLPETYLVDTAPDAQTALEKVGREAYDLILLDINLRDTINGVEVLRRIREESPCEESLVVAMTAYALPGDGESFYEEGFDGYVSKPFTRETLYERLVQVM